MDDYLSALMNRSKNLKSNIDIYNDTLKSISSKLSMVTNTSDFINIYIYIYIYVYISIKMGKINGENSDLKSKLNIVSGIIANAKKDLESLKTEINDVKSDHALFKKGLNFLNNEFSEYLKESLKVTDNLIKIDNDILMTKNESYINIKNWRHVIKNDTLINITKCIKLKSMLRENVKSLKNIKNNDSSDSSDSIQLDLKKLKEEFINNFNKRAKIRSITTIKTKTNKTSPKNNAADIKKGSVIVDACTSIDDIYCQKIC